MANKRTQNKSKAPIIDDSSNSEPDLLASQSSTAESQNDDVSEETVKTKISITSTSNNNIKKRNRKREEDENDDVSDAEKSESVLYTFPMNRIDRIIRSEIPDVRLAQEAVFVINLASEKFLQLFAKEAYACAFVDRKNHIAYNHLSSVVSKRKRFDFLSDFVPEKVKAEDALAQIPEAEK